MTKNNRGLLYTYRSIEYLEMRQDQVNKMKRSTPEAMAKRKANLRKKLKSIK